MAGTILFPDLSVTDAKPACLDDGIDLPINQFAEIAASDRPVVVMDHIARWIETRLKATSAQPRREILYVWRRLVESSGAAQMRELANDIGWSDRHLTAEFQRAFRTGPKKIARLVRFERAYQMVATSDNPLADIAYALGYADQSHLTREFAMLGGMSPTDARRGADADQTAADIPVLEVLLAR